MTLTDLFLKIKNVGDRFNTWQLPLKMDGKDVEVEIEAVEDENEGWIANIEMK